MMTQDSQLPRMEASEKGPTVLRSRLTLVGLIATFIVPLILAMFLYARLDIWKPNVYVNHGQLMQPVAPLAYLSAESAEGVLDLAALEGRWVLVYLGQGACGISCQAQLFKMRQSRAMLGRDLVRVQTVFLALGDDAKNSIDTLTRDHPALTVGRVAQSAVSQQLAAFSATDGGRFYLIDPHGNLVLKYEGESTTKGVVRDLKRLLKVSNIG